MHETTEARKKARFLKALAEKGTVLAAAKVAKIGRATAYRWREADPDFAAGWIEAEQQAADVLEAEARRRAVDGVDKPVFQGGAQVGTVREYSDTLLIFLLKGRRSDVFKDRVTQEHSGPGGGPIAHNHSVRIADLPDDELMELVSSARNTGTESNPAATGGGSS